VNDAIRSLILGESAVIRRVRRLIEQIAATRLPVLIQGPTGSGKELVAEALHLASGRTGPLVAFNVCAIGDGLFESTLFGHARGAFTGANNDLRGYLAEADRGTLFLDEIGGLSPALQPKLLRALETRQFRPVGAKRDVQSDFRVVSATNVALENIVADGRMRADLAQRVSAVIIDVPSLDERVDDIRLLAAHFARCAPDAPHGPAELNPAAVRLLEAREWPGNVRELRQVVETAVAVAESTCVGVSDVIAVMPSRFGISEISGRLARVRQRLIGAMRQANGHVPGAAALLGRNRATVYRQLERFSLQHLIASPGELPDTDAVAFVASSRTQSHLSVAHEAEPF
jgi:DNA-binding NtrC family response regulator